MVPFEAYKKSGIKELDALNFKCLSDINFTEKRQVKSVQRDWYQPKTITLDIGAALDRIVEKRPERKQILSSPPEQESPRNARRRPSPTKHPIVNLARIVVGAMFCLLIVGLLFSNHHAAQRTERSYAPTTGASATPLPSATSKTTALDPGDESAVTHTTTKPFNPGVDRIPTRSQNESKRVTGQIRN
jgi:hypothetical protein